MVQAMECGVSLQLLQYQFIITMLVLSFWLVAANKFEPLREKRDLWVVLVVTLPDKHAQPFCNDVQLALSEAFFSSIQWKDKEGIRDVVVWSGSTLFAQAYLSKNLGSFW